LNTLERQKQDSIKQELARIESEEKELEAEKHAIAYKKIREKILEIKQERFAEELKSNPDALPEVEYEDLDFYVDLFQNEEGFQKWYNENIPEYPDFCDFWTPDPTINKECHEKLGTTNFVNEIFSDEIQESETPKITTDPEPTSICGTGTIMKDGICVVDTSKTTEESSTGGGCLIATATYGSELSPQVQQLRELRDNQLLNTESGSAFLSAFNDFYYSFSPIIADYERENPVFREMVKIVITPMISSLSILNYVDMDSEVEVLGYGISLIVLNAMMYVGIPASVIVVIRNRNKI